MNANQWKRNAFIYLIGGNCIEEASKGQRSLPKGIFASDNNIFLAGWETIGKKDLIKNFWVSRGKHLVTPRKKNQGYNNKDTNHDSDHNTGLWQQVHRTFITRYRLQAV